MVATKKGSPGRQKTRGLNPKRKKKAADPAAGNNNLIGQGNRQLKGMRDICEYVGFSESTILAWIRERNFPAKKTADAGIWVSTTNKIDQWREIALH